MFDMEDKDFSSKLMSALGVEKGDSITIMTPQFERTDGLNVLYFPSTIKEYEALKSLEKEDLKKTGCQVWDEVTEDTEDEDLEAGYRYWLFPKEWFQFVPEGLEICDIFGNIEKFERENTDDDIRYGCLSFGFRQKL